MASYVSILNIIVQVISHLLQSPTLLRGQPINTKRIHVLWLKAQFPHNPMIFPKQISLMFSETAIEHSKSEETIMLFSETIAQSTPVFSQLKSMEQSSAIDSHWSMTSLRLYRLCVCKILWIYSCRPRHIVLTEH